MIHLLQQQSVTQIIMMIIKLLCFSSSHVHTHEQTLFFLNDIYRNLRLWLRSKTKQRKEFFSYQNNRSSSRLHYTLILIFMKSWRIQKQHFYQRNYCSFLPAMQSLELLDQALVVNVFENLEDVKLKRCLKIGRIIIL